MSKVIAISGNGGAGKTTLTHALSKSLDATFLSWDDFDPISKDPADYIEWYAKGQDYSAWDYPRLAETLSLLKKGETVNHPVLETLLSPTPWIIFDAPLGYLHPQTAPYIDVCFHLEVPLDVALCRRLLRDFKEPNAQLADLLGELDYYLTHSRPLYDDTDLKKSADHVLDGLRPVAELIDIIVSHLPK